MDVENNHHDTSSGAAAKEDAHVSSDDQSFTSGSDIHAQGVERISAISAAFTPSLKVFLFLGIFLVAYAYGLDATLRGTYQTFATNSYSHHSLLGTMNTVRAILAAAIQPAYARVADKFGRVELLSFAVVFYTVGTITCSASNDVNAFTAGQLLWQIGYSGLMLLIEVLIADVTSLENRVLLSFVPALPFLINTWVSGDIAQAVMGSAGWRWGIAMWCIILPVCAVALFAPVMLAKHRAAKQGKLPPRRLTKDARSLGAKVYEIAEEIDLVGIVLLGAMLTLILLPLTLAGGITQSWSSAHIIAMLVIGVVVCVPAFAIWEIKFAKYPCVPFSVLTDRTILAGLTIAIGLNMSWYLQGDFLFTVLSVSFNQTIRSATRIASLYSFCSVLAGVVTGFAVRVVKRVKPFAVAGTLVFILAMGLLIKYRDGEAGVAGMIGSQVVLGIGGGLFSYPVQALVQAATSHENMATVTAMYLSFYQIGSALGNAISTAIWTQVLPRTLQQELGSADMASDAFSTPLTFIEDYAVGTPERTAIIAAYSQVQRYLAITGLCLSVITFAASLLLRNFKVDGRQSLTEEERKGRVTAAH
ncbi:MFS transporter [Durotheca rogersii]|uniref:MFS transporter n=1 Tax=Durotheca rogersii TaxID=419775 RepID=UPI0022207570|nr:MFS transporter [Durotheca rogersii]KAI5868707.1 MFS transporter [Durotheca rogersii]